MALPVAHSILTLQSPVRFFLPDCVHKLVLYNLQNLMYVQFSVLLSSSFKGVVYNIAALTFTSLNKRNQNSNDINQGLNEFSAVTSHLKW